jgi:hypothetical protein
MEVTVAIAILSVGLVALASLVAQTISGTARSKYVSLASMLASEKLEDLNRWPSVDNHIVVTGGSTAGSLTSDVVANVTVGTTTESINYFDEVLLATGNGSISQAVGSLNSSGNTVYTTTTLDPTGAPPTTSTSTTQPNTPETIIFKRRWLIEKDTPVANVRRITVLVTLQNQFVHPAVTFQMSTVRP